MDDLFNKILTIKQFEESMNNPVIIASAHTGLDGRHKTLEFIPSTLDFKITKRKGGFINPVEYISYEGTVDGALEEYNKPLCSK